MVKKKGKSKRISLKDKYKIQKRTLETHRKARKQAKRDTKNGVVRNEKKKRDPGIPNSWPFKQELLNDIAKAREQEEAKKKEKKQTQVLHTTTGLVAVKSLEEFMAMAQSKNAHFDAKQHLSLSSVPLEQKNASQSINNSQQQGRMNPQTLEKKQYGQQSRRAYLRDLRKVIDSSDVLLQILDARDPLGTRIHPAIENVILGHYDKKMVLVLNKIDLIPKQAVSGWLTYLRRSHPTVAIKCGTNQNSTKEIGRTKGDTALQSSSGVGVESLLNLLKNYCRTSFSSKKKTCISVGIIGYPNVGKSSILNTLKRSRAVGVSPRPGFTTSLQEVVLDRNVRLIDSPGVVFDEEVSDSSGGGSSNSTSLFLKNCIDADSIDDPIPAVEALLQRCSTDSLIMTYNIPAFPKGNTMMFLAMVAKQYGKVLKGGIPDKITAARTVLRDWNSGKIPYYTPPPLSTTTTTVPLSSTDVLLQKTKDKNVTHVEKGHVTIVSSFADEFDVSKMDAEVLNSLEDRDEFDFVPIEPMTVDAKTNNSAYLQSQAVRYLTAPLEEDDDEEMIGDDEEDEDEDYNDEENDDDDEEDDEMDDDDDEDDDHPTSFKNADIENAEDYDFSRM